jgi:hypothetical protein
MAIESGDRPGLVRQAGQRLAALDLSLSEPVDRFLPWRNMSHGLVGAMYSLRSAIPVLSDRERAFEQIASDTRAMIEAIRTSRDLAVHDAKLWYVGYFLNNAEVRITWILHQVLKAAYLCHDHFDKAKFPVPRLVGMIHGKTPCPTCETRPLNLDLESEHTVTAIVEKTTTFPLFMVHDWTNGLKHKQVPDVDKLPPTTRWDTDFEAFETLLNMFVDFANRSGVLDVVGPIDRPSS